MCTVSTALDTENTTDVISDSCYDSKPKVLVIDKVIVILLLGMYRQVQVSQGTITYVGFCSGPKMDRNSKMKGKRKR